MPIYEYQCEDCQKVFEYLVMGGKDPESCPKCKKTNIKRMMSACGFVSKSPGGLSMKTSASSSSCGSCTAGSCAGCH
jgi:putative FmdB family regulatory protein